MKKHAVAFVGFEHAHMSGIYGDIAANDAFHIVGAWEPEESVRRSAEEKGVVFTHDDPDSLLQSADTVAIGAHYGGRGALAIKALQAGKNVIADKPLCTTLGELETIRQLSEEKNLTVCMFLSLRQTPNILAAVTAVQEGVIGRVNNIIFEGEHPLNYGKRPGWYYDRKKHGGVINDLAIHGIDLVRRMTGSDLQKVDKAKEWNFFATEEPQFKDSAQFMLTLQSGAGVLGDVSYSAPDAHGYTHPGYWHFRVFGALGMLDFGENIDSVTLYPKDGPVTVLPPVEPKLDMLEEFLAAVDGTIDRKEYTHNMLEATRQTLMIENAAEVI